MLKEVGDENPRLTSVLPEQDTHLSRELAKMLLVIKVPRRVKAGKEESKWWLQRKD
ncbi:hypothetical protein Pcinc_002909 [Petrolisthes cinctipes]|uniref:Uncharacterized protein n=1 Tax=Petrolisthes cinctipes TaxID=88211 RepID=A0AAE1GHB3_PETCI|nr:hypothetical protein Pcinc_002909 [Petrolisthes cinctipes]